MNRLRRLIRRQEFRFTLCAPLSDSGRCEVSDALMNLKKSNPNEMKKVAALLDHVGRHAFDLLRQDRYKLLREGVGELRTKSGMRLICFRTNFDFIVIHSVFNKGEVSAKRQTRYIDLAIEYKKNLGQFTIED